MERNERWQVRIVGSITGLRLVARRGGKGPWLHAIKIPQHVRDFFCANEGGAVDYETIPTLDKLRELAKEEGTSLIRWQRAKHGALGYFRIPAPMRPPYRRPTRAKNAIRTLADLCDFFGADEPSGLNHRIYKDTDCGASISLYLADGTAVHNGEARWSTLTRQTKIHGFTIQTIVEGSDSTVDSDTFALPVSHREVNRWIAEMEERASQIWLEENDSPEATTRD